MGNQSTKSDVPNEKGDAPTEKGERCYGCGKTSSEYKDQYPRFHCMCYDSSDKTHPYRGICTHCLMLPDSYKFLPPGHTGHVIHRTSDDYKNALDKAFKYADRVFSMNTLKTFPDGSEELEITPEGKEPKIFHIPSNKCLCCN